jgi:alkyl sulfatase BDS1-like metallo-beta-lactamase superfamily hydrolase
MSRAANPVWRERPGGHDIRPAAPGDVRPINEFIYLSEGLSNSYLIVTEEGRVVVNTGMGFEGPIHKANYDGISTDPVRYVLLTQGHVDHVGGVDVFREPGTEIVAQAGNAAHQRDDALIARFRARRSAFAFANAIARANQHMKESGFAPTAQAKPEPTIVFEDHLELEVGGLELQLLSTPGGETLDSMVIWLPQHRICFTGNLFSALFGHFPNLVTIRGDRHRSAIEFVRSLDRVAALEPEMLLVGHHDPIEGRERVREELDRLRAAVLYVHDETVRGMNDGTDVYTLMSEIQLPPELDVGEGYGKVAWSVRAIWEYYAGWFHARATSELYPCAPDAVNRELVALAGGVAAVAKRAHERLAEDKPLEALQLAEAAVAFAPTDRAALAASLAVHRVLRESSVNFWESSWLDREIRAQEASLAEAL